MLLQNCRIVFSTTNAAAAAAVSATSSVSLSAVVLMAGFVLLVTILLWTTVQHTPARRRNQHVHAELAQLGLRPPGRNLWEWWWQYTTTSTTSARARTPPAIVGIAGYDPILGAFDPATRTHCHIAAILCVWGVLLRCLEAGSTPTTGTTTATSMCTSFRHDVLPLGLVTLVVYLVMMVYLVPYYCAPVSKPGGPRPHKIRRIPYWNEQQCTTIPHQQLHGWTYLSAESSHQHTRAQFAGTTTTPATKTTPPPLPPAAPDKTTPADPLLTGEAAGRQTWFKVVVQEPKSVPTKKHKEQATSDAGDKKTGTEPPYHDASSPARRRSGVSTFLKNLLSPSSSASSSNKKVTAVTTIDDGGGSSRGDTPSIDSAVDETVVQEMALGGRDKPGFDPSVNPNTNDQIYRAQQIRTYMLKYENSNSRNNNNNNNNNNQKTNAKNPSTTCLPPPPDLHSVPITVEDACRKGVQFYNMLQCDDGHWAGDYGGPHFLLPGLVIAWYVMHRPTLLLDDDQLGMIRHYLEVHQQLDGGWGTHIESPSTMFGTVLMYVALRLVGASAECERCVTAREFMNTHGGGALYTSSWSKFYLCILGVMDWRGHNSVPPEMWLLPNWFPFHPGRMWCHARMVYLPMGYLYGTRYVYDRADSDRLIQQLRTELYHPAGPKYAEIPWVQTRHYIATTDNYSPIPIVMKLVQNMLARYENWTLFAPFRSYIRQRGLEFSIEYMKAEDLQTNYINIGPVNKVMNMLSMYHYYADTSHEEEEENAKKKGVEESEEAREESSTLISSSSSSSSSRILEKHMARVRDYLWLAEDGLKMQGYNGSQCWDTSFCVQALYESQMLDEFPTLTKKVWNYLERTQILSTSVSKSSPAYSFETNEQRYASYRHISEGGWPFSTSAHGWPISDCTGEGLKAMLCLLKTRTIQTALNNNYNNEEQQRDDTDDDNSDGSSKVVVGDSDSHCGYDENENDNIRPVIFDDDGVVVRAISDERLYKAANILLTYQNEDGGWATYENNRGWGWYEQLNPSEVFGDIMIDYSYVECSMASLTVR